MTPVQRTLTRVRVALVLAGMCAVAGAATISLPPPAGSWPTASFVTVIDMTPSCRLVAFDGFAVHLEDGVGATTMSVIGELPAGALGATDPAFMRVSPSGRRILLGAGFGGSLGFGDPSLRGRLYVLEPGAAVARLAGSVPDHVQAELLDESRALLTAGDPTFTSGSVVLFDLDTGASLTVMTGIPGSPGDLAIDSAGELFVGLGFAVDPARTGEIRRFDSGRVLAAMGGAAPPLDFEHDGALIGRVLSAAELELDAGGNLLVGGGDLYGTTGDYGYFAVIDPETGAILERVDPSDGDPDDGDFVFYSLAHCAELGVTFAVDLNEFLFGGVASVSITPTAAPLLPVTATLQPHSLQLASRGGSSSVTVRLSGGTTPLLEAVAATGLVLAVAGAEMPLLSAGAGAAPVYKVDRGALVAAVLGVGAPDEVELTLRAGALELTTVTLHVLH